MNKSRFKIGSIIFLSLVAQVSAVPFTDITGGFNVLTFGDFTAGNDQTWGSLGASGDVIISGGYTVGTQWAGSGNYSRDVLVSGGNVSLQDGGNVWGRLSAAGSVDVSSGQTVHGGINAPVADINSIFNFGEAKAQLDTYSSYLTSQTSVEAQDLWGSGLLFTGTNTDINYFTVDAIDFQGRSYLQFDIASGSKAVITVTGNDVSFVPTWGGNFGIQGLGGDGGKAYASNILWNFAEATSLKIGGSIGTILATNATTELVGGEIWGDLITGSAIGNSEMHLAQWGGDIPTTDVPEPSIVSMIALGTFGVFAISRKRFLFKNK